MQINFKKLLICSSILFSCIVNNNVNADIRWNQNNNFMMGNNNINNNMQWKQNNFVNNNMQWNPISPCNIAVQNNWNNNWNFNNNIAIQNNMQQLLINKTKNNKDGIATNWQSVNKFDWQLFKSNISTFASARTSAVRALKSLFVGDGAQNFTNHQQNRDEFSARLICAEHIGGLINFYSGNFNNVSKVYTRAPEYELFTMIANYYISCLDNGYDISVTQNNLQTLSWQQSGTLLSVLNNLGYQAYYQNYFVPRRLDTLKECNNIASEFLPNNIKVQHWNSAITMVKKIDLAGSLKKLIKGVNIATYFENFRRHDNTTDNSQVNLANGKGKCAFNSMFQLLSSGLQKQKQSNITSQFTTGYFADFDEYLRNKQASTGQELILVDELWKFEKTLSKEALLLWNSDSKVLQAKNELKKMQNEFSHENWMTILSLFSQVFPELKELYDKNDNSNCLNVIPKECNSEQFYKLNTSKNYLLFQGPGNSGLGMINTGVQKNILFNDINNNQYIICFDKQGQLFMYELTGLQLSVPGHNVAYTQYDNSSYNWRVVDSLGQDKSSSCGMQLPGIFKDKKFEYLKNYSGVAAYMFKKVSSQEFIKYMPQGLVL